MALALSNRDLARLEAVHRTLLSPLAAPDVSTWRAQVLDAFRDLLGVNRTLFAIPLPAGLDYFSADMDSADLGRFGNFVSEARPGVLHSHDVALDRWFSERRRRNLPLYNDAVMDRVTGGTYTRSTFYYEVVKEGRMFEHQGYSVDLPAGEAIVCLSYDRPGASKPRWDRLAVLGTARLALVAGLETLGRLNAHRAALDAVAEPLAAFTADGVEVYRSAPLRGLLEADPEAAVIECALAQLALRARPLAFARRGDAPDLPAPTAEIRTTHSHYTLRVALLSSDGLGFGDAFLVSVTAGGGAPAFPAVAEVRARHGLTEREAEVAVLVARGLSNDAIGERLFVSRHTVRHHVESVMAKLELTGRGREAVAARLLDSDLAAVS